EKKLVAEIKKTAKTGNEASLSFSNFVTQSATKILARQLLRITNLQGSCAQIRGVATHTQAMYAKTSILTVMKGATKAMAAMNMVHSKQMAAAKQAKLIKEFQKESQQLYMMIEMMSESIDETLDKDKAEEETEEFTNQISSAPKGRVTRKKVENAIPSNSACVDAISHIATMDELQPNLCGVATVLIPLAQRTCWHC
ncbi:Snf7 family, partial [Dillenia turbinata]